MGINIYLSSFTLKHLLDYKERFPNAEMNILISFGTRSSDYYDLIFTHRDKINSLILDSGAFSLNFAGQNAAEKISLNGFIAYIKQKRIRNQFDFIFNYDEDFKLDGFGTNLENLKKIEKAIKNGRDKLVPVVHDYQGEKKPELDYYIQKKYPIIALGYSEHKMKDKKQNITTAVNKIIKAGLKVHLLGVTEVDILKDLPVHYCDSSSWAQEALHGNIVWWNPYEPGENKLNRVLFLDRENTEERFDRHIGNYPFRKKFEAYLKNELGLTMTDLYGNDKDYCRQLANIHFFVKLQDEIRKLHSQKNIVVI